MTKEKLAPLHRVDYQHNDAKDGDQTCKCSQYFLEELGGVEGLVAGLDSTYEPDGNKGINDVGSIAARNVHN